MFDIILENKINETGKTILGGVLVKHGRVSCDVVHDFSVGVIGMFCFGGINDKSHAARHV